MGAIQHGDPSAQHPAGLGTKKGAVAVRAWYGDRDLIDRYEQLRSDILHGARGVHQSLGWSHFVRHGMATWMQAVTHERYQTATLPCAQRVEATRWRPSASVVSVLAGMALGCLVEVA